MESTVEIDVEARGIEKSFGPIKVLQGVDLAVERGTVLALLGPNGAGKTTTVRILATLLHPDAGVARVAGYDVVRSPRLVRGAISLTGQNVALDEWQTGDENMLMMGRLLHLSRPEARRRAMQLLDQFDLLEARKRPVKTYSGGMRRRLDLALSLIGRPRVIFLDEPTTGLDPASRQSMWAAIRALVSAGTTVLLTTQYLEEADQLADRIAVIDGGRVIAEGTANDLKAAVAGERADLTFPSDDDFRQACQALGGAVTRTDRRRLLISVATDGSAAQVRRLLDHLEAQRIAVDTIALHRPSLDDVFFALTQEPNAASAAGDETASMEVAR